jgi:hypothetical protein
MLTTEEIFWYTIIICIISIILYYIFNNHDIIESYKKKKTKEKTKEGRKDIIGKAKVVHVMNLRPVFPNIVPFRDHVHTWIVNVPLTPFRAPLIKLPPLEDGELPPFLLYKMEYLTPIRNQGDCGSCFIFATCDMLSDRATIQSGGLFKHNLSVQQVLSCFATDGCDGGSPEELCFWLSDSRKRLVTEKKFPYKQGKGGEVTKKCPTFEDEGYQVGIVFDSVFSIVEFIPETDYDEKILESNILNMKLELYEGGPFYCAMTVYDDFFEYTGLKPYKPSKHATIVGGHAIEVIGYCEKGKDPRKDFKNTGYWVCRNSWGDGSWPTQTTLDGFFTIVMGSNICGIESRCGYSTPMVYGPSYKGTPKKLNDLRYTSYNEYMQL